ncbi:MAG: DUF3501 family protein [Deltaproteobacteria bacterium]|nr:DUF3501 family protein [Deltaproteobacteria bacterium]
MKRVERQEILPLGEYEAVREPFRRRVIEEKRRRRVALGDQVSAVFENHDTVLLQVQEMLRTERITREDAVLYELDTYNALIPGEGELSMTMFVEIADRDLRERRLVELAGLEDSVALEIDGVPIPARGEFRDGAVAGRTTAVHYMRLSLPAEAAARLRTCDVHDVALAVSHPAYSVRVPLPRETVAELASDLA